MRRRKQQRQPWPNVYSKVNPGGSTSWIVNLGQLNGGPRERYFYKTKEQADTFSEQARLQKQNQGLSAFTLAKEIRVDAIKASGILKPHEVSLTEAANYYIKQVIAFRNAPPVKEIVEKMLQEAESNGRRERTIEDLKHRLNLFAEDF